MPCKRKKLFVDRTVQTALLLRVAMYWGLCLLAVGMMVACWIVLTDRPATSAELVQRVWHQCGLAAVASLIVFPVVLVDCLRVSNRFTGPIQRIRRAMRQLAKGERIEPISFRQGDYWLEVVDEFNAAFASNIETPAQKA